MIKNPILPGTNGDPSIIRTGDDFYLVTSTFEWFPGVPLYHSRDLKNWELVDYLLKSKEALDLTGLRPSRGVWAPCLTFDEKKHHFCLMYSNVHNRNDLFFDVDNYLIWTDDIRGTWSRPIYINSSGFDPSMFHDDDGRTWVVNKDRDFRPRNVDSRAIVVQEFDFEQHRMIGEPVIISKGATQRRFVEGAHLYKHGGWYYLTTAEGGTGYGHCVALSRSRQVTGPYEPCPHNPILTSNPEDFSGSEFDHFMMPERYNPAADLQKAGHGSLVETANGEWYMAHLCGRPVMPQQRCILGRETAIQKMEWTADGWLQMVGGGKVARLEVAEPALAPEPVAAPDPFCDFDDGRISLHFNTVRNEITPEWADAASHKGFLRLRGQESLTSNYKVSLLARRLTAFRATATAKLHFAPEHYRHLAGITCYYDTESHYTAYKTYDEDRGSEILTAYGYINSQYQDLDVAVEVPTGQPVWLRASFDHASLRFFYSLDGQDYLPLGPELDSTALSDEASRCGCFTGTYVGMFAQDMLTRSKWAEFDWFRYEVAE